MPFTLPHGISLTWLGHSTFLIETARGTRILIDPWVDNNPSCPIDHHQLGTIHLMLISHGHYDHIQDALPVAAATGCRVVGVYELIDWLTRKGILANVAHRYDLLYPMNKGGTLAFPDLGLSVSMVHADHTCGIKDGDHIVYGGEAVGFVITLDDGFTFYHTGDTAVFGDMSLISDLYRPTLAMLPIGDRFVMSPKEAARAVKLHPDTKFPAVEALPANLSRFRK